MVLGFDRDRGVEARFLPAAGRLAGKGHFGQFGARRGPEVADVRSRIADRLVEADSADVPVDLGAELGPEFDRFGIGVLRAGERFVPDRAGTGLGDDVDVDLVPGALEVGAVVDGAGDDRDRALFPRSPGVGPACRAAGEVPARSPVDRDFDRADLSPWFALAFEVRGGSFDRVRLAAGDFGPAVGGWRSRSSAQSCPWIRRRPPGRPAGFPAARPCRRRGSPSPVACASRPGFRCDRAGRRDPTTTAPSPRRTPVPRSAPGRGSGGG